MDVSRFIAQKTYGSFSRSLIRNIIRISIISTALSMAVMIVAGSVFEGFKSQIASKVFGFWGHIHVTDLQVSRSIEPFLISNSDSIVDLINRADYKSIGLREDAVSETERFVVLPAIIGNHQGQEGLFLKGVDPEFNPSFAKEFLKDGQWLDFADSLFSRDVLISEQSALKAKINVGDAVIGHFVLDGKMIKRKLKVTGIYRTGLEEYDRKFAIVDIRLLQDLLGWKPDEVTGIEIFVKNLSQASVISQYLYEEVLPSNLYCETIREKFPNIFEWLALQDINRSFILGLILLVCIINMVTTTLILILERTQMIGLLSALGMDLWNQRKIFIRYGIQIVFKGILSGMVIGIAICLIQWKWKLIKLSEADYYLDHAPVALNPITWFILALVFFITITASLLIPSWLVSRIRPVNALRFR
ncbi:MAG: ABC transporter permease [Saprospiraceae bacterium]|nr:ABC transporter permease [Saprospiraceae bacterium]